VIITLLHLEGKQKTESAVEKVFLFHSNNKYTVVCELSREQSDYTKAYLRPLTILPTVFTALHVLHASRSSHARATLLPEIFRQTDPVRVETQITDPPVEKRRFSIYFRS